MQSRSSVCCKWFSAATTKATAAAQESPALGTGQRLHKCRLAAWAPLRAAPRRQRRSYKRRIVLRRAMASARAGSAAGREREREGEHAAVLPSKAIRQAERWYQMSPKSVVGVGASVVTVAAGLLWFGAMLSSASAKCHAVPDCARRLSAGWLPLGSGTVDLTDAQWEGLRGRLGLLALVFVVLAAASRAIRSCTGALSAPTGAAVAPAPAGRSPGSSPSSGGATATAKGPLSFGPSLHAAASEEGRGLEAAQARRGRLASSSRAAPPSMVVWYAVVGVLFTVVLVGADALVVFLITGVTLAISRIPSDVSLGSLMGFPPRERSAGGGGGGSTLLALPLGPVLGWAHLLGWMAFVGNGIPRGWSMDVGELTLGALRPLKAALPGLYRWTQLYNLLLLRLASFLMDSHWATANSGGAAASPPAALRSSSAAVPRSPPEPEAVAVGPDGVALTPAHAACVAHGHAPPPLLIAAQAARPACPFAVEGWTARRLREEAADGLDARARQHRPDADYGATTLAAYALYPPLLVAGPVLTFNAFASQLSSPRRAAAAPAAVLGYAARWLLVALILEAWLHAWPVYAINTAAVTVCNGVPVDAAGAPLGASVSRPALPHAAAGGPVPAAQGCHEEQLLARLDLQETLALWEASVALLWIKFVVVWRFFRAAALADGMGVEENQASCVWMTSSIGGFWRGWHRSFNRWIVRYLYVPLGGSAGSVAGQAASSALVFAFVALWHEFSAQLLLWGLVFGVLTAPELLLDRLVHSARSEWARRLRQSAWYPLVVAVQGTLAVFILIFGNLLGFGTGVRGLGAYAQRFGSWEGLVAWVLFAGWHLAVVSLSSSVRAARGFEVSRPPL